MPGGGLVRDGDGFLLATGSGDFYRLEWEPGKDVLRANRLALTAPLDWAGFRADLPKRERREDAADGRADRPLRWEILRVTDVALDDRVSPARLYVAHMHWSRPGKCMTLRVSMAPLPPSQPAPGPAPEWKTIFETQPCLAATPAYEGTETGGRLAWTRDGKLLFTAGDFGFNGVHGPPILAQADDNDYGKIHLLDLAGGKTLYSKGHRNPQGLLVDRKGRVWETEHGPQGGDELNLLRRGANFGWPYETHGTDYGRATWPVAKRAVKDAAYEPPVHAFTPAIAISNLIELGPALFPQWDGDLLVASLSAQSLFRIRLADDRVAYVEPVRIGRRIRDVEQGKDGRIVLWTDEGDLVVLARAASDAPGELLYRMCERCHESIAGGQAIAPNLRGVAGNAVAAQRGYPYSPALAKAGRHVDRRAPRCVPARPAGVRARNLDGVRRPRRCRRAQGAREAPEALPVKPDRA